MMACARGGSACDGDNDDGILIFYILVAVLPILRYYRLHF